jgi:lipopolysaccharide/colanic/teichoic acid biosynthesis glycosyltransferase
VGERALVVEREPQAGLEPGSRTSWLVGFHGAVRALDVDGDVPVSLRSLALAHRSLGTERLSILTDLPSLRDTRPAPSARDGHRPVGAPTEFEPGVAQVVEAVSQSPTSVADADAYAHAVAVADAAGAGALADVDAHAHAVADANAAAAADVPAVDAHAAAQVPRGTDPGSAEVWDEVEPLADYLDRRLLQARVLYLPNRGRAYRAFKRGIDIVGASVLLALSSPVMLVLAVLIRLDSPGPAIFRHERVTLGGRLFVFYKFRTMWVDARERYPELYDYRRTGRFGEVFYKLQDDPRNTRVGRWLRRTTLDELPNLVNVLRGDMTLVGPRPELPQLLSHYRPEDLALFFAKAGLTGLAQVAGRSLLTVRERITIDLRYVAQQTLILDLRILARTVKVVFVGKGAF